MSDAQPSNALDAPVLSQYLATAFLGPFFAAWISHFILSGVVFTQYTAYIETNLYKTDPLSTKVLLWTVFILDLTCLGLHGEEIFHYGTTQDRSFASIFVTRQSDMVPLFLPAIGSALLSSFLCRRAAGLFNSNLTYQSLFLWGFHALIAIAFVAQCGAFVLCIRGEFSGTAITPNQLTGIWLWISSFVDWSMTIALFLLLRQRFDGNLSSVRKVLSISIQTASYTSVLTVLGAITAVIWPAERVETANILVSFQGPLSALYALSLVVTLSSRRERTVVVVGATTVATKGGGVGSDEFMDKGGAAESKRQPVQESREEEDDEEEGDGWDEDEDENEGGFGGAREEKGVAFIVGGGGGGAALPV